MFPKRLGDSFVYVNINTVKNKNKKYSGITCEWLCLIKVENKNTP